MGSAAMKVGDTAKIIGIPPDVRDDDELKTRTLFETCLGKTFQIASLERVARLEYPLIELRVGSSEIWIEPCYVELVTPA